MKSKIAHLCSVERGWIAALFLAALGARLLYLHQMRADPLFDVPLIDAETYVEHARRIAQGDWLGDRPFWQAPLYPYFLAVLYRIFGQGYYLSRLVQFLIGALSCVLIYLIGKRVFNRTVGGIAALIASLYGPLLYFEGQFLASGLSAFLNLVLILSLLRLARTPNVRKGLWAGLLLGLSAIARSNVLLFGPLALVWLWWTFRNEGTENKALLRWNAAFCAGALLIIAPITLRNFIVGKDFVLISSNAGINFYIGNNPDYERTIGIRPGTGWEELVDEPVQAGLTKPSQRSRFFFAKSWAFIRRHPLQYAELLLKKLRLFWSGDEIKRNQNIYAARFYSPLLSVLLWKKHGIAFPFGLVGPLALMGIVLSVGVCRRQTPIWLNTLLLLFFVFAQMTSVVLFFVSARYRVPVLPFLILFAAYTLWWGFEQIRTRKIRPLMRAVPLLVALLIVANLGVGDMDAMADPEVHFALGVAYERKAMVARALLEYRKAVELAPNHVRARNNLATMYAEQGRYDQAIPHYKKALNIAPDNVHLRYNLAKSYMRKGDSDKAIPQYKEVIRRAPNYAEGGVYLDLGYIYMQQDALNEAIAVYKEAIQIAPDRADVHRNLAIAYTRKGRTEEAIAAYRKVLEIQPDHSEARHDLAVLLKR